MRTVLVCKNALLPYSETFIRDQVLACSTWRAVLFGMQRVVGGLALDGLEVRVTGDGERTLVSRVLRRMTWDLALPAPKAIRRMKLESPSLLHVHFGTDAVEWWPSLRKLNLPVVVTLHGYDINRQEESWRKSLLAVGNRRYPGRLRAMAREPGVTFIAVSEAIKRRAVEFGIPDERIHVRYIGIDIGRFQPGHIGVALRIPRILFVGRLVEKKGADILIRAFAKVQQELPPSELVIIGSGPMLGSLQELARQLSITVAFEGSQGRDEVIRQLHAARVFCLPSVTADDGDAEGLPISILEAQACGVPVVTSARGGVSEGILDGVTGLAFPERDVDTLADRLIRLLADDNLACSMSQAAPTFIARRFDIRTRTRELEALYDTLV